MIVVDTSVWIGYLRGSDSRSVQMLRHSIQQDAVLVGDLVLLELLQGARDDAHAALLYGELAFFPIVPMMSELVSVKAASIYRSLRADGVTIRKTVDLVIATFCLVNDHELLQDDRDFQPVADRFGLRLV